MLVIPLRNTARSLTRKKTHNFFVDTDVSTCSSLSKLHPLGCLLDQWAFKPEGEINLPAELKRVEDANGGTAITQRRAQYRGLEHWIPVAPEE
jgi:hypothetical protein